MSKTIKSKTINWILTILADSLSFWGVFFFCIMLYNTVLYIWSDEGIYNNKNFDMKFSMNVRAEYMDSKLFAEKADYSNSENYLSIYLK